MLYGEKGHLACLSLCYAIMLIYSLPHVIILHGVRNTFPEQWVEVRLNTAVLCLISSRFINVYLSYFFTNTEIDMPYID